jgi:hypothetical protein
MARVKKGSWIVMGEGDHPAKCLRCGEYLHLPLPQHMEVFIAASRAFLKVHEKCLLSESLLAE